MKSRPLGRTGFITSRIGISATYRPGERAIRAALDAGVNYLFCFSIDTQMTRVIRSLSPRQRDQVIIGTGAYNFYWGRQDFRKALDKTLRRLKTDRIEVFHYLGITKPEHFPKSAREELLRMKEDNRIGAISVSIHHRKLAGELAASASVDALMLRYNAAHPGAEQDIFPYIPKHQTGVIAYTATRWGRLIRKVPGIKKGDRIPTAAECYRWVISNPNVDTVLTAPRNEQELQQNLKAIAQGPLSADDLSFMRDYGKRVHDTAARFW